MANQYNPVAHIKGTGKSLGIDFLKPTTINHAILQEDLSQGQRVLSFCLEGLDPHGKWLEVYSGTSVGHKKICYFTPVTVSKIKVLFLNVKADPRIIRVKRLIW